MRELFNVINTPSMAIVIDEMAEPKIGDKVWNNKSQSIDTVVEDILATSMMLHTLDFNACIISAAKNYKHPVIIASIGHDRIGQLPIVNIPDDRELDIEQLLKQKAKSNNTIDLNAYGNGLIDGSSLHNLKYQFTEEQLRLAIALARENEILESVCGTYVLNYKKTFEDIIQLINQPKRIKSVALEMEEDGDSEISGRESINYSLKIHNHSPEGGSINPIKINYI